jgi:hypothetical protein
MADGGRQARSWAQSAFVGARAARAATAATADGAADGAATANGRGVRRRATSAFVGRGRWPRPDSYASRLRRTGEFVGGAG